MKESVKIYLIGIYADRIKPIKVYVVITSKEVY